MRDVSEFLALSVIALAIVIGEIILALTNSAPTELHAALLIIIAILGGGATFKKNGGGS